MPTTRFAAAALAVLLLALPVRADAGDRTRDNIAAFAQLVGLLQHFHPSDQAAAADWSRVVREGAPAAAGADSPEALAAALTRVLAPLAPSIQVFPSDAPPAPPSPLLASAENPFAGVVFWRHIGFTTMQQDNIFARDRMLIGLRNADGLRRVPDPTDFPIFDLGAGVSCRMPISVWVDTQGRSLPLPGAGEADSAAARLSGPTLDALVPVILVWGAVQHFSPAFIDSPENMPIEWLDALREAVSQALAAEEGQDALRPCSVMLTALHDAQSLIVPTSFDASPPMRLEWIDGALLVAEADEGAPLRVGDRIVEIEGHAAADWMAHALVAAPGAREEVRAHTALAVGLLGPAGSTLSLSVRSPGDDAVRPVEVVRRSLPPTTNNPREVAPGVFYVDPSAYDDSSFIAVLNGPLSGAKAVIADYRSLAARGLHRHLGSFLKTEAPPITRLVPTPLRPNRVRMGLLNREALIVPNIPHNPAKLILLVDAGTRSDPELDVVFVKRAKIGTIVGERTAGAAGPAAYYDIRDGDRRLVAQWTGTGTTLDGAQPTFARGVEPDIVVLPTAEGLAAGRDEALEAAIRAAQE